MVLAGFLIIGVFVVVWFSVTPTKATRKAVRSSSAPSTSVTPSSPLPMVSAPPDVVHPLPPEVHVDRRIPQYTESSLRDAVARVVREPTVTTRPTPQLSLTTVTGWAGSCKIEVVLQLASDEATARTAATAEVSAGAHFVALDGTRVFSVTDENGCSGNYADTLVERVAR
jgi:hypothetical protein